MAENAKAQQNQQEIEKAKQQGLDDAQIRQESSKAAGQALKLQEQAQELRQAAHGAADAEERQKLLEQAIDKEIAAESFGKTAKYMRSGTFQGMAVGAGIGVAPGATLGTLTGTLVGGVTSLVTGGLGAGIGALTGVLHGPFWNMGELAGKGIQKVTGNWWSRRATDEQKQTLERMMHQTKEQEMPGKAELQSMSSEAGSAATSAGQAAKTGAKSWMPSMSWGQSNEESTEIDKSGLDGNEQTQHGEQTMQDAGKSERRKQGPPIGAGRTNPQGTRADDNAVRQLAERSKQPRQQPQTSTSKAKSTPVQNPTAAKDESIQAAASRPSNEQPSPKQPERKKPRKLQVRSDGGNARPAPASPVERRKPRKLETRS